MDILFGQALLAPWGQSLFPCLGDIDLTHSVLTRNLRSTVPDPPASAPPGALLERNILGPTPNLLNQKLGGWAQHSVFLGGSGVRSSLRTLDPNKLYLQYT